jgi:ketosteroid isomerase-like protein
MFSWLAKKMLQRNLEIVRGGDPSPHLKMSADDVKFTFPGDSSWAGEIDNKKDLEVWLNRFCDAGLQIYADEVILQGFPWKMTLCVRGIDHLESPEGEMVYENRYVIWGQMKWGKLRNYEVYEDTKATDALDEYLERIGKLPAAEASPA